MKGLVGIYGGTFDPIHFGHLNLALEIMEARGLSEVWFCPARINPHKQSAMPSEMLHRLEMVKLALEDIPHCSMIDIEATRDGPSYMIDTLRILMEREKKEPSPRQFCLIVGEDVIPHFLRWRSPEEIVRMVPIFVGKRSLDAFPSIEGNPEVNAAFQRGATATHIMQICSTEVRQRLAQGLYCGHLVPSKVLDYIYEHKLY